MSEEVYIRSGLQAKTPETSESPDSRLRTRIEFQARLNGYTKAVGMFAE
jgi:hypothetical protein